MIYDLDMFRPRCFVCWLIISFFAGEQQQLVLDGVLDGDKVPQRRYQRFPFQLKLPNKTIVFITIS